MNWYYVELGQQAGPVSDAQLEELRRNGRIQADSLVWREGLPNWIPYSEAKGEIKPAMAVAVAPSVAPPFLPAGDPVEAVCAECHGIFSKEEMIRHGAAYVCKNCKPVFMQKLAEGARLGVGGLNYAGFWIRLVAKMLDNFIVCVVVAVPILVLIFVFAASSSRYNAGAVPEDNLFHASSSAGAEVVFQLVALFGQFLVYGLLALYSTFFNGKYGATPGKMICKLEVVDMNGGRITYGRAFGRACAEILSGFVCNIGYIIAAFDDQKRSLHDHICNTRVVYKQG